MGLSRKQIIMLAVLVFGTFVTVLNQTVVAPALPSVMAEMSVDASTAQWLTTGFTLVNAIMIPITAFLTDRFTTKRLFLVSMVIFTAGSALAGWGPNFAVLLLGRLVQAAGAGILMPLVMTVLMWTFPVDKRGTAMGLFNANAQTLLPSLKLGAAGFSGVMANFHPDLYARLYQLFCQGDSRAQALQDFLGFAALSEKSAYPVTAKYHMNLVGVPMELITRTRLASDLDEQAKIETRALVTLENQVRRLLA